MVDWCFKLFSIVQDIRKRCFFCDSGGGVIVSDYLPYMDFSSRFGMPNPGSSFGKRPTIQSRNPECI